jgi:hypothetical protein
MHAARHVAGKPICSAYGWGRGKLATETAEMTAI